MKKERRALYCDLKRAFDLTRGNILYRLILCLSAPGVQAVIVLRFGQWAKARSLIIRLLLDPVYVVLNLLIKILWGIEIPRSTKIGPGFYIGHFGGITISSAATIGANCNISQGVTIGVSGQGERMGAPAIGRDVYIASGAKLFGKICVGSNSKIGANAVVSRDVPDNAIVVLDPGFRIVSMKGNIRP